MRRQTPAVADLTDDLRAGMEGLPRPPTLPELKTSVGMLSPDQQVLTPEEREARRRAVRLSRPLGLLGEMYYRLVARLARDPFKRAYAKHRLALHDKAVRRCKAQRKSQRELFKEADIFAEIIVGVWSRRGYQHVFEKGGRRRVHRVAIERICCQEERIYYKVLTTRRTPLRWKNALLYKVDAALVSDETLWELSVACQRRVTRFAEDRKGVWVIVDRLEGVSGLPKVVRFQAMLDCFPDESKDPEKRRAAICLGVREHRKIEFADLEDHPHVLVGGESGGGKSNFVNNILCGLIQRLPPSRIRLFLVDLKRVEFTMYAGVPHLAAPVVTEADDVIALLGSLVALIKERMKRMEGRARKLSDWNRKHPGDAMPRVLLVIDEFAEIMLGQPKSVSDLAVALLSEITNLGRAAGVHALVCTQRPSIQVVPSNIKFNMPLRIAGAVSTASDSATILGVGDAAQLDDLPGRMVVKSGRHRFQVQTPLVTDGDIRRAVAASREWPEAEELVLPEPRLPLVYNRPALLREVVNPDGALQGSLAVSRLVEEFSSEGMNRDLARSFVAWCRNEAARRGVLEIGEEKYVLVEERNSCHLAPALADEDVPEDTSPPGVVENLVSEVKQQESDPLLEEYRAIRKKHKPQPWPV